MCLVAVRVQRVGAHDARMGRPRRLLDLVIIDLSRSEDRVAQCVAKSVLRPIVIDTLEPQSCFEASVPTSPTTCL